MNKFQIIAFGLVLFFTGIGIGSWARPEPKVAEAPLVQPQVTLGEVTELVDRLKSVAYEPNGEWYSNGINLTFTGRDIALKIKTKNGNEYNARARQLKDVVNMIADPAGDLRAALQGWNMSGK